jgi:hypothetical protein
MMFASCGGLLLLSIVWMELMWLSEVATLVLPDAADVHIEQPSLSRQHITYYLPLNQTPNDLYERLVRTGWARDMRGELGRSHDQSDADAFVVFWRQSWLGLVPEVVTVRRATRDQHMVDIQLSRCIALGSWMRCL